MTTWTDKDLAEFDRRYPHEKTADLANDLGRTVNSLYYRANIRGIGKSAAFFASPASGRTDGTRGLSSRFAKGHVTWNTGHKGYDAGGRSHETRFKKGQQPHTWLPIGSYRRTTAEQFWVLKVQDHGLQREKWIPLHKLIWIEHNGPIPPKHVVRFKDGDVDNVTIDNLECISMAENCRRNSIHNLPKPVVDVLYQKARLTREINKQRRSSEEQHRRSA